MGVKLSTQMGLALASGSEEEQSKTENLLKRAAKAARVQMPNSYGKSALSVSLAVIEQKKMAVNG